jgi:hypothetical protein
MVYQILTLPAVKQPQGYVFEGITDILGHPMTHLEDVLNLNYSDMVSVNNG